MAILEGLSATKAGFELIKGLREILKRDQVDPHEVSNRLMELQELLLDARNALSDAADENRELRRQLTEVNERRQLSANLLFADHAYWKHNDEGKLDGPFCPTCWDSDEKLVRLIYLSEGTLEHTKERCRRFRCQLHQLFVNIPSRIFKDVIVS